MSRAGLRASLLIGLVTGGVYAVWLLARQPSADLLAALSSGGVGELSFVRQVNGLCALLLLSGSVWLGATTARAASHSPRVARRILLVCCGVALSAGVVGGPALGGGSEGRHDGASAGRGADGLLLPDRATGTGHRRDPPDITTVARADSLWSISARHLPADATDAVVDEAWRSLYRRNLARIGGNPDLIHPGITLHVPRLDELPRPDRKDHP